MSRKVIGVIICILLVIALIYLIKNANNDVIEVNVYAQNTEIVENVIEKETNAIEENTVQLENVVPDNQIIQNSIVQDNLITSPEKNVYESETNVGTTNKKQEAINLVKDYWGEDSSVNFSCDSVTSNGEYIIAVTSKKTASVSGYFRVNLEKKTVEVDY